MALNCLCPTDTSAAPSLPHPFTIIVNLCSLSSQMRPRMPVIPYAVSHAVPRLVVSAALWHSGGSNATSSAADADLREHSAAFSRGALPILPQQENAVRRG